MRLVVTNEENRALAAYVGHRVFWIRPRGVRELPGGPGSVEFGRPGGWTLLGYRGDRLIYYLRGLHAPDSD